MAIEATATDFDQQVTGPLTVVDFWAPWCGPCKMMEPIMAELEEEFGDRIKFVKFNVDHQQAIAERYKVMSVPSLVLFRDGVAKEKVTGIYPKDRLAHYFARKTAE